LAGNRTGKRRFPLSSTSTFNYRHFDVQRDFTSLVALLNEVEQADRDGEDVGEAMLREQLTWPGHDPARDRWIATTGDSGQLVGYGAMFKTPNDEHADMYIAVHPAWRRRGIGSGLLARVLVRAREAAASDARVYANAERPGPNAFLLKYGFAPVSAYTRMALAGTQAFPAPDLPEGFVIHSYDQVGRMDVLVDIMNRGYQGLWGHHWITIEEMAEWFPQLTLEGLFLLFAPDGTVAGICHAEMSEHLSALRGVSTGWIDAPGVAAEYREDVFYRSLLLTAMRWLAPQSPSVIELESWGDAAQTLAAYSTLGFTVVQEQISYRLLLG
jgi:mycothiol synthase